MRKFQKITKFQPGSMRELIKLALPLIMISLSENIMIFFDRIILSHYSLTSLNAVTLASQAIEIFQYGLWTIASMSELFIAGLYAKNITGEMSTPCWQMIYLSLFTAPLFIILANYTGNIVLPPQFEPAGIGYYKIAMCCAPLIGIITALSGFFIGQGKVRLVLFSTVVINIVN